MFNLQVLGGQNFVLLGKANVSCCPRAMHTESTGIQLRICSVEAFAVSPQWKHPMDQGLLSISVVPCYHSV